MIPRYRGMVRRWSAEDGYGFVTHEGQDLFLSWRDADFHRFDIGPGATVSYTLGTDHKGRRCATNARLVVTNPKETRNAY